MRDVECFGENPTSDTQDATGAGDRALSGENLPRASRVVNLSVAGARAAVSPTSVPRGQARPDVKRTRRNVVMEEEGLKC
jgi:hypothetical protein